MQVLHQRGWVGLAFPLGDRLAAGLQQNAPKSLASAIVVLLTGSQTIFVKYAEYQREMSPKEVEGKKILTRHLLPHSFSFAIGPNQKYHFKSCYDWFNFDIFRLLQPLTAN